MQNYTYDIKTELKRAIRFELMKSKYSFIIPYRDTVKKIDKVIDEIEYRKGV